MDNIELKVRRFSAESFNMHGDVIREPYTEIEDDKIYRVENVLNGYGDTYAYKKELIMTKETFIEAYNKFIKDADNDKRTDSTGE